MKTQRVASTRWIAVAAVVGLGALALPTAVAGDEYSGPEAPSGADIEWSSLGVSDGLPAEKVLSIRTTKDTVWVGTENGAAYLEEGRWKRLGPEDGLSHPAVYAIAEDRDTGDVWFATAGGLTRYSAGRTDRFDQLNSGLANDVVYGLTVHRGEVWAATAAGCSRYDTRTRSWQIYDEKNTPMHEIWCYGVSARDSMLYLAVWGGGLLEYDFAHDRWKEYRDPDREMEIDLFRDDGLVHDVIASVWQGEKKVWAGTYFGVSSYDGRRWKSYMEDDSGLASNFVNYVYGRGEMVWFCTDRGLSSFDGKTWWTYSRREDGKGEARRGWGDSAVTSETPGALADNFVLGIDSRGDELWVATAAGLSVGRPARKVSTLGGAEQ